METSKMQREKVINGMAASMAKLTQHDLAVRVVGMLINDEGVINRYQETIELVLEAYRQCILIHHIGKDRLEHVKRGGTYDLAVPIARVQTDTPLTDYAEVSVYRADSDGSWWVRPHTEMGDGRFKIIESRDASPPPQDGKKRSMSGFSFDSIVLAPGAALKRIIELEEMLLTDMLNEPKKGENLWKESFEQAIAECKLMAADPLAKPDDKKFYQGVIASVDTLEMHKQRLEDRLKAEGEKP